MALSVIRVCSHFFTLPEDPVMVIRCRHSQDRASMPPALRKIKPQSTVRKIKPQSAQRITESCYFYLSPPLCHSVPSVVFQTLISKISKSLRGFGYCNARYQRPYKIMLWKSHHQLAPRTHIDGTAESEVITAGSWSAALACNRWNNRDAAWTFIA